MLNKLKIVVLVAATVVGMVVYKRQFDAREAAKKAKSRRTRSSKQEQHRWN